MITVVGVGIERGDLTAKGKKAIKLADKVYSRVKLYIKSEVLSKDFDGDDYLELDRYIVDRLVAEEEGDKNIVYLALGDGFTDTAVKLLCEERAVKIIAGVSEYRGRQAGEEVRFISAYELKNRPLYDTDAPLVVFGIDNAFVASEVKLILSESYGDETLCRFSSGKKSVSIPIYELDRQKKYEMSAVAVTGGEKLIDKNRYVFGDLITVMRALTAPDGCPWDKAQTHESIRINLLEEAYEAVDAIDSGDIDNLREELGDVLLQVIFHCDMSEREGEFTLGEIVHELVNKLVFRHTHIFGKNHAENAGEALDFWEKAKAVEKSYSTLAEQIDRLPDSFPALLFAQKAYKKSKKAGVKVEKVKEKLDNLLNEGVSEKTLGKILLYLVMLASEVDASAEVELSKATKEMTDEIKKAEEQGTLSSVGERL